MREFTVVSKKEVYSSPWLKLNELSIERDGEPGTYAVVERADSVIVLISDERDRVLMERQFRFPTDSYSWELVMGGIDEGESVEAAARRELQEETGVVTAAIELVGQFCPVPGLMPQRASVFVGHISSAEMDAVLQRRASADEIAEYAAPSPDQLAEMIRGGEVTDGFTLSALHIALNRAS